MHLERNNFNEVFCKKLKLVLSRLNKTNHSIYIPCLMFFSIVCFSSQAKSGRLIGLLDNKLVEINHETLSLELITNTTIPNNVTARELTYAEKDCLFYTFQDWNETPKLYSLDINGNYNLIGNVTIPGELVSTIEALTFNNDDAFIYASASLNGIDFFAESIIKIDPTNAIASIVGTLSNGATLQTDIDNICYADQTLYISDGSPSDNQSAYYSIDFTNITDPITLTFLKLTAYKRAFDETFFDNRVYSVIENLGLCYYDVNTSAINYIGEIQTSLDFNGEELFGLTYIENFFKQDSLITYMGCKQDGYTYTSPSGILYSETNPTGTEILEDSNGCNYQLTVDLVFNNNGQNVLETYEGCTGDGYTFVSPNGNIYNHDNTTGTEVVMDEFGCNYNLIIDFTFNLIEHNINLTTCFNESLEFNGRSLFAGDTAQFKLQTISGCDSLLTVYVTEEEIQFLNDTIYNFGLEENTQLVANTNISNATIQWWPNENLNCYNCFDPLFTGNSSQSFEVTITNLNNGCQKTFSVSVIIESGNILVPTAFSPNSDGINDEFQVLS